MDFYSICTSDTKNCNYTEIDYGVTILEWMLG